jgi:hypothetical protein
VVGAVLQVLLVAMAKEAQYLVHFSTFQSLAAAQEVAVFLAPMRQSTLPVINNKMARLVVQEGAVLVTVHPHLHQMAVVPVYLDKDCQAHQAEIHPPPPIGQCPVAEAEAVEEELQVQDHSALQLLVQQVVQVVRVFFGP